MQIFAVIFGASVLYAIYYLNKLKYKTGSKSTVDDMVQNPMDYKQLMTEKELASNTMNYDFPNIPDRESNLTDSGYKPTDLNQVQAFFSEKTAPDFELPRFPLNRPGDPVLGNLGVYTETIGQGANKAFEPRNINV